MHKQYFLRIAIVLQTAAVFLCIFATSGCSDEPVTPAVISDAPFDESDIRVKVYDALYTELRLDTLGCAAMAVAEGDSLFEGMFWPSIFIAHPPDVPFSLAALVPLRILGMNEVRLSSAQVFDPPYVTDDTEELAIAAFTKTIERTGPFNLVVVCGVMHRWERCAFGVCNLEYAMDEWNVTSVIPYYIRMRD